MISLDKAQKTYQTYKVKLNPFIVSKAGIYILAIPPPLGGGNFLPQLKNREEFEEGLEKRKGKGKKRRKKRKRVIKHRLKYLYEA